jgi:5-methyltetrahydropteroyltriglutamate--homocysteine methyltransferase
VQIDFTEGRLSLKLDPSGALLDSSWRSTTYPRPLHGRASDASASTCPGGDRDSTHSADVDYAGLLPALFRLHVGRFYLQRQRRDPGVLRILRDLHQPGHSCSSHRPINPIIETPELVRDRLLLAAKSIPVPSSPRPTTADSRRSERRLHVARHRVRENPRARGWHGAGVAPAWLSSWA